MHPKKRNLPDDIFISPGEIRMKDLLNKIFIKKRYFDNYRPDWLVNSQTGHNLEFDRYYPDLNLAFEFGGNNHRQPDQRKRDKIKQRIADNFGVAIIYVSWKQIMAPWFDEHKMRETIAYWKKRYSARLAKKSEKR